MKRFAVLAVMLGLLGPACAGVRSQRHPVELAVSIETDACGHTSRTNGSGILVSPGRVITAAHVVIGASAIRVSTDSGTVEATVVRMDVTNDLAILQVPETTMAAVELSQVAAGARVTVLGGSSGLVDASVVRRLRMGVDDVRRTTRSQRSGFELDAAILPGDSGAGVFDSQGRLVGVVFAVPTERGDATFAVDAAEIESLLATPDQAHQCDPAVSLVVPDRP